MEHITRIAASLAGVAILAFAAGIFLASVDATSAWYYAVGLPLVCLGVLRMFAPTMGVSTRSFGPGKRSGQKESGHTPSPIG